MIKKYKKYLFLLLFGFFLLIPKDTYADGLNNVPTGAGSFRYYINSDGTGSWNGYYPQELLTSSTNYEKYLYYITTGLPDLSNDYSGLYYTNSVRATLQLHRMGNQGVMDWHQNVPMKMVCMSNEQTPQNGNCAVKSANNQYLTFECMCTYNHNEYPISADIQIGTYNFTHGTTTWIGRTIRSSDSSLYIQAVQYEATSSGSSSGDSGTDLTETNDKIDDVKDSVDDVKDSVDDLTDAITDDSSVSSSELEDFFEDIPLITSGPISDLMLLPTFILNAIINRSETTCPAGSYFSIDLPYVDGGFEFHCWTLSDYLDSGTLNMITWILYVVMFYNLAMLIISCWETWTNLSTDFASMYSPKHGESEYKPKHGGGN